MSLSLSCCVVAYIYILSSQYNRLEHVTDTSYIYWPASTLVEFKAYKNA